MDMKVVEKLKALNRYFRYMVCGKMVRDYGIIRNKKYPWHEDVLQIYHKSGVNIVGGGGR